MHTKVQYLNIYYKNSNTSKPQSRTNDADKIQTEIQQREIQLDHTKKVVETLVGSKKLIGDAETRLWLTTDIGLLNISDDVKFTRLKQVLSNKSDVHDNNNSKFIDQLLLLCCHRLPWEVSRIFKHRGSVFRTFFEEDRSRIRKWFNHFKYSGNHLFGAFGLEQYLFENREEYWSKLRWIGKRDVPPCVAVHKKNLFLELDVVHAVEMLADNDDKFWGSTQFQEDLASGDFLAIDYMYFVNELKDLLRDERDAPPVRELIDKYLRTETHKELCQQLLHFFSDDEFLSFVYHIAEYSKDMPLSDFVISECRWQSIAELALYNAVCSHANTIMSHFLKDDEAASVREDFDEWLCSNSPLNTPEDKQKDLNSHWSYRQHLLDAHSKSSVGATALLQARFVLLEGFLLLYRLKAGDMTRADMEAFFDNEGIQHVPVVVQEEAPQEEDSKHSKRKHKHKRRRSLSPSPPPPTFVGWQFSTNTREKTPSITYGIKEAPQYLHSLFLDGALRWLLYNSK